MGFRVGEWMDIYEFFVLSIVLIVDEHGVYYQGYVGSFISRERIERAGSNDTLLESQAPM